MRLELRIEGGFAVFPGLGGPFVVETDRLPDEEARRLAELVRQARVYEREATPLPPGRRADARSYHLSVESPAGRRTLVLHDPLEPELRSLVEFLSARQRQSRTP